MNEKDNKNNLKLQILDNLVNSDMKIKNEFSENNLDNSSNKDKKDIELSCSLPLSLEMPEVNVNLVNIINNENIHHNKEIKEENINHNSNPNETIKMSQNFNSNLYESNTGFSPFINNNIHNFNFNNYNMKGKNLFFGANFESPFRRNGNILSNQFSPSPLTIKVANSASINKSINEIDFNYQNYHGYPLYQYYPINHIDHPTSNLGLNSDTPWNSKMRNNLHISSSPLMNKRNLNFGFNKNENLDILSYLNDENQKEIKDKENVKIKLQKK